MTGLAGLNVCTETQLVCCAFLKSKQTTYNTTTLAGRKLATITVLIKKTSGGFVRF